MSADWMNGFKDIDPAPHKKAACRCCLLFGFTVSLKIDTAGIRCQQRLYLFPAFPVLYPKIHMLRCAVVELMPPEHSAVSIQECDGFLCFSYHLRFKIQVCHQIERPELLYVKSKMVLIRLPVFQVSCLLPGLIGIIPEVFIETDPIYWLMLQNPLNASCMFSILKLVR